MSSSKSVSWKRFPIGELARKRKALREDYMAAESETARLQNDVNIAQKDVNKLKKGYEEMCLTNLQIPPIKGTNRHRFQPGPH